MPQLSQSSRAVLLIPALFLAIAVMLYMSGVWQQAVVQVVIWQGELYRALVAAITQIRQAPTLQAWGVLLGVSFGYGVFHAAGPGHGKVVLSTYVASQNSHWRRALGLSMLAALLQGLTAIALIAVLVFALGWLTREAMGTLHQAELASFIMVTLIGLWLCWQALRALWVRRLSESSQVLTGITAFKPLSSTHLPSVMSVKPGTSQDDTGHGACSVCGHDHHLDPAKVHDWRIALLTALSIGIRPCSGAVLLLGASALLHQFGKGVVAVLAMSLGTSLTVAALAILSVVAKDWVARRLGNSSGAGHWSAWIRLFGGVVILLFGLSLTLAFLRYSPTTVPVLLGP
ncbi:nickel/cobalt transporter [Pokkaliibacter sp. CJK22405]|uniref:nickel/cobalt transporter n=1 Tax=Pokkaliibacter sp. CJK22405 TaxID=3384615 RepID=UPI003984847A